jgi:hypothetical protein
MPGDQQTSGIDASAPIRWRRNIESGPTGRGVTDMVCASCGKSILLGGIREGARTYCSRKCLEADEIGRLGAMIPARFVDAHATGIHGGSCPKCNGPGPVDVHPSYTVWSAVVFTKCRTREHIVCMECAGRRQRRDLLSCALLGWWGIPFGPLATPLQIARNVAALYADPGAGGPSDALREKVRRLLVQRRQRNKGVIR